MGGNCPPNGACMKINQAIDALKAGTASASGVKVEKTDQAAQKARTGAAGVAATGSEKGSLSISNLSSKLQTLETSLASGEAYDAAKVSQVRQSIRDGSFKINAEGIADRLLANAHDLFIKRH